MTRCFLQSLNSCWTCWMLFLYLLPVKEKRVCEEKFLLKTVINVWTTKHNFVQRNCRLLVSMLRESWVNVFLSRNVRGVTYEANIEPCKRLLLSGATEKRGITSTFPDDATAIHGQESPRVQGMPLSLTLTCVFLCAHLCRKCFPQIMFSCPVMQ